VSEGTDRNYTVQWTTNQALGLLIMAAGIVMLAFVFLWAYHLYQSINGEMFSVQPAVHPVQVAGGSPTAPSPGAMTAKLGERSSPLPTALALAARLCVLLVMGWLAGLLASKGVALATSTPHKQP
jgi:hypothetical protein